MSVTISSRGHIPRYDRATSGSDQRPMYDHRDDLRPMVRLIDRYILRPIVREIAASCDRAYDQSWHPKIDGTINRGVQRSIARPIVASCVRSYDQSLRPTTDRTINRGTKTIWNRRLEVLNMTIDLATTDVAIAITHDLCDQSYVLSTICPRFQNCSVAG